MDKRGSKYFFAKVILIRYLCKMNTTTLEELKNKHIGKVGTNRRDAYERDFKAFSIGIKIRLARQEQNLTQKQLAERINRNRAFISRIENEGSNMTLKTLYDIVERGLGKKLEVFIG